MINRIHNTSYVFIFCPLDITSWFTVWEWLDGTCNHGQFSLESRGSINSGMRETREALLYWTAILFSLPMHCLWETYELFFGYSNLSSFKYVWRRPLYTCFKGNKDGLGTVKKIDMDAHQKLWVGRHSSNQLSIIPLGRNHLIFPSYVKMNNPSEI